MQKFGLDSLSSKRYSALEFEIVKEQASALGIAGRNLQFSLDKYYKETKSTIDKEFEKQLINDISSHLRSLLLQREFVGFVHGNMDWVKKNYNVPTRAIQILGVSN
jgi:hypothetical protein